MTSRHTSRQRLLDAHLAAASFYRQALEGSTGPRAYLTARGVGDAIDGAIEGGRWAIGYAPPGWTNLLNHLDASGFTYQEIHAAGLTVETRRGTLIDRFRDRVMFGIHDADGDLVAFIGRCAPAATEVPKYLNSRATDLYIKGRELFGLGEQITALHSGAIPVLVEGPLDVLAIAQLAHHSSANNSGANLAAVSTCGTALRPEQADLLRAHSAPEVIVAYDGDEAGHRAARSAYTELGGRFERVWTAGLPDDEDPASLAVSDPPRLLDALARRTPLADQLLDDVIGHYRLDNAEARVAALHRSTRTIATLAPADVSRQVARVAERLEFDPNHVTADLTDAVSRNTSTGRRQVGGIHQRSHDAGTAARLSQ